MVKQSDHQLTFAITSSLEDEATFNSDLTVVIPQANVQVARALSGKGQELKHTVLQDKLLIEVPVDAGEVRVDWK